MDLKMMNFVMLGFVLSSGLICETAAGYEVRRELVQDGFWRQVFLKLFAYANHPDDESAVSGYDDLPRSDEPCPEFPHPPIPFVNLLKSMLQHEMRSDNNHGMNKRYLPPKWGFDKNLGKAVQTAQVTTTPKIPTSPIFILSTLSDRTVCIGSEQLPFPFPVNPNQQIPYLNVLNSFIRYVNHRKKYPHKMATITLPEMELLLAKQTRSDPPSLLNYHL